MHRHTLKFGTLANSQNLRLKSYFFCPDDIKLCVKGSRRKWVDKFSADQERPPIPPVWSVKIGTNLTRPEILKLKNAGFQLPRKESITPTRLFNTSAFPLDLSGVDVPANPDFYPSSRQSKATRRSATAPSIKQIQMVASARTMDEIILKVTMIPRLGFGCVLTLQSKPARTQSIYQFTVSSLPECNCPAFKDMISKFGRKQKNFMPCKHLYFVFVKVHSWNWFVHTRPYLQLQWSQTHSRGRPLDTIYFLEFLSAYHYIRLWYMCPFLDLLCTHNWLI